MPSTRILLLCIGAAVLYGILHDQITARLCLEYFTVAHPPMISSQDPTIIALYWGFAATWWVGAIFGLGLALACRAGALPRLSAGDLLQPILRLYLTMAASALLTGCVGYWLTSSGTVPPGNWQSLAPAGGEARFAADLDAHRTSYAVGFLGSLYLIFTVFQRRHSMHDALVR